MKTGIYVHVPFCVQRCTYCDFNTYTGLLDLQEDYVDALSHEIELRTERAINVEARTLYFGGGTPSLLDVDSVSRIISEVRRHAQIPWEAEVTLEANPGTVGEAKLAGLREAGVNRLSLGVQSSHSRELLLLGRIHTWEDAERSYQMARRAGFRNINLDLMYGLPDQSLTRWLETVNRALALGPDHLSLYALTLEVGTPLSEVLMLHGVPKPDPDLAADMYDAASERLQAAGFWQYEISNWARGTAPAPKIWALPPEGRTEEIGATISEHNLIYWRNEPWLGFGAGAHSWFRGRRWSNYPHPRAYISAMRSDRMKGFYDTVLSPGIVHGETMMMGLRLAEGVTDRRFHRQFDLHLTDLYEPVLTRYQDYGLITWDGARVRLSPHGRLLGNQVFEAFLLEE